MGHAHLGQLPRSKDWYQVIDLIAEWGSVQEIAGATMKAAQKGLEKAISDPGVIHAFWLLTQIPLAARTHDFRAALHKAGIDLSGQGTLIDIVTAMTQATDRYLRIPGRRTDLGELATMAAAEALMVLAAPRAASILKPTAEDVTSALRSLSTKTQFQGLAKQFFARFAKRFLSAILSRELSNHVGAADRFPNIDAHAEFLKSLDVHCHQAARILTDFSREWFSKNAYHGGITLNKTRGFVAVALRKLGDELRAGHMT
jgi:hypothetical protein